MDNTSFLLNSSQLFRQNERSFGSKYNPPSVAKEIISDLLVDISFWCIIIFICLVIL